MPARLIPQDLGTHFVLGTLIVLVVLPLGGAVWAALACLAAAVGRELYGWWRRGWRSFDRADWIESGRDIASTLAGGAVVLAGAAIGI
jgi:hypothetical protein